MQRSDKDAPHQTGSRWAVWLFTSLLILFIGFQLISRYFNSQEQAANQQPIPEVMLSPSTKTPEAKATATEVKPTATEIPTQLVQEVVVRPTEEIGPSPTKSRPPNNAVLLSYPDRTLYTVVCVQGACLTWVSIDKGQTWSSPRPSTIEEMRTAAEHDPRVASLLPTPTPIPKLEVKWETGGPNEPHPEGSAGIYAILAEPNGTVRAVELEHKGWTWVSTDYGKSWSDQPRLATPEEEKAARAHSLQLNAPFYLVKYKPSPIEETLPIFEYHTSYAVLTAEVGDITLAAIVRSPNNPSETDTSRLFLSRDGKKTWIEINTPPNFWSASSSIRQVIGAIAITKMEDGIRVYVGFAHGRDPTSQVWIATLKSLPNDILNMFREGFFFLITNINYFVV